ncbi:MAG: HAD family hydrolase [Ectothiorhodospiraceae bacterium]|nr:HAD family hydrolase [Ectothiorhodospiraceae bacterium]
MGSSRGGPLPDFSSIQAVAFDLDGTLVQSSLDFQAIRQELGFPRDRGLLEHIATLGDGAAATEAHAVIQRHELAAAAEAAWMPGAVELLDAIRDAGLPTAILTRNTRLAVDVMRETLGIPVPLILTREDCRPKPDPDGLLRIGRHYGVRPGRMVYVGDFIYDLQTARAAGSVACLYRNGENARFASQAHWVINHLGELTHALSAWMERSCGG